MELDDDFALALQLQSQFDEQDSSVDQIQSFLPPNADCEIVTDISSDGDKSEMSLIDPRWEMIDPIPDVRALFMEFNDKYFWGQLAGIEVRWSPRMTLCAGLCVYEGRGGMCSVRLSEPLLKLRPRKDLIETLLHEMIHAYLFVTDNNKDHDGHGPEFCKHMHRLNKKCGTKISIYHNFHDEVDHHRQHWWRCNGPCQSRKPYFGYVKRAMNRAPSPRDTWWAQHQATCGGTYTKIKEPEGYGKKNEKKSESTKPTNGFADIRSIFKKQQDSTSTREKKPAATTTTSSTSSFPGSGISIGGSNSNVNGPVVRKLPSIGIVTTERLTTTESRANKRPLTGNDPEMAKGKKVKLHDKKKLERKKSLSDLIKDKPFSPPGTCEKIPGFQSTANRNNWSDKKKKNTEPIVSDDVYIPLGNRPNVTPNSVLSMEERARLRRLINEAKSPSFTRPSAGLWGGEPELSNKTNHGASTSTSGFPSTSTNDRDESLWPGSHASPVTNNIGTQGTWAGAGDSASAGANGAVGGVEEVACPVCTLLMPQSQINAHLDTCLI